MLNHLSKLARNGVQSTDLRVLEVWFMNKNIITTREYRSTVSVVQYCSISRVKNFLPGALDRAVLWIRFM